jgi:hypothetical protein
MEIPKKLYDKWQALRSYGDSKDMSELLPGTAPETFNRAFREKKCRDDVFETMAAFYEKKAALIKEYL